MDANKQKIYDSYLQHLLIKGFAKDTVKIYSKEAKSFLEYVVDIKSVTTPIALAYLTKYSHLAKSTRNLHGVSLQSFTNYLSKNIYLGMNKVNIKHIKTGRKLPNILDANELLDRVNALKMDVGFKYNWKTKRDYALIMLLYATGMRVSEALNFRMDDIDDGWIRIENGKGNKDRYVPIAKEAIIALEKYVRICPHSQDKKFFLRRTGTAISRTDVFKILKKQIGLNPHSMRHHFATHLILNGCDVGIVSELLGHSNISTTSIYTHIKKPRLANTVNNCHPMAGGEVYAI